MHSDKTNKPVPLFEKVKETAAECSKLLRLLPLIIANLIPQGDKIWLLYIDFHEIVQFVTSPALSRGDLFYMRQQISRFLKEWFTMNSDVTVKPKAHYLIHYPTQYETFEPLVDSSTLRFESKHQVLKQSICHSKNSINLIRSMANKHQFSQTYYNQSKNFLNESISCKKQKQINILSLNGHFSKIESFTNSGSLTVSESITYEGITYRKNGAVILHFDDIMHTFSKIVYGFVYNDVVHLLLQYLRTESVNEHYNVHIVNEVEEYRVHLLESLLSPICLPFYNIGEEMALILPYVVS